MNATLEQREGTLTNVLNDYQQMRQKLQEVNQIQGADQMLPPIDDNFAFLQPQVDYNNPQPVQD